jgi:hypothetical protein
MTGNGAETLEERVEAVIAELEGVAVVLSDDERELRTRGRLFAVVSSDALEVVLDPAVAAAARRTPDVTGSARGPAWVTFRPRVADRFALDRAEAWLRSAHRGPPGRA